MLASLSRRAGLVAATALLCSVGLAGCGSSSNNTPPQAGGSPATSYGLISAGVIQAASDGQQPPFVTADSGGHLQGFVIDLINKAAQDLGLEVNYKVTSVPSALAGLTTGQYDLVANGLGVTSAREQSVAFTKPIYWSTTAVVTKMSSTASSLNDFSGKHVGVVTGAVQESFITDKMPGAVSTKFQKAGAGMTQLESGSIDAFVIGGPDAEEYLKQYSDLKIAVSAPVDRPTSLAVPKTEPKLQAALNTELQKMIDDGTYQKFYEKYFVTPPIKQLVDAWPKLAAAASSSATPTS